MKKGFTICLFFAVFHIASAQVVFKTILPPGPFVEGESFQVQFLLEDVDENSEFYPPGFKGFRVVSGPYVYIGTAVGADGQKQLKNIIYTIEAPKAGKFFIEAASARVNGNLIRTDRTSLKVISKGEAVNMGLFPEINAGATGSTSFLQPGEDPYEKIRKNLFVKVWVDKRSCFVGEPVTATFKLYSRLESRSDIVKNPGFYGFTVQDMIGLEDNQVVAEIINGKKFDVHTIRMVQLYPLRAGSFIIDPMEIENKVKFSKSAVGKKSEQEIVEGIFPDETYLNPNGKIYETKMNTEAIAITVKPYPEKNVPPGFSGATGNFSVNAAIDKRTLAENEEGHLEITISGQGNFTQLTPPAIRWPEGIEGFEPETKDDLDSGKIPLTGKRTFRFPFVSGKPGEYTIPAVDFSFFDPDTNKYKTVSSESPDIAIHQGVIVENEDQAKENKGIKSYTIIAWLIVIIALAGGSWLWFSKRKKKASSSGTIEKDTPLTIAEILQPARFFQSANNKAFYALLRSCIWNFFTTRFHLSGSKMNRQNLLAVMQQSKVGEQYQQSVMEILAQCEAGIFTDAATEADRNALLDKTTNTLEQIEKCC